MNKVNTSERLKYIMKEKNLRQVDILNLSLPFCNKYNVKMNKSDISQYVSGKVEPSQEKLVVLGMALNVNESWLMGFDVPMERNENKFYTKKNVEKYEIDEQLKKIIDCYNNMNEEGKTLLSNQAEFFLSQYPKIGKKDAAI